MKGNLRNAVYHILQIRKPLIPFSMHIFIKTSTLSRLVTVSTSFLAASQSKQGTKKEVPLSKLRQSIS